jgi:hypothetical protein
MGRIDNGAKKNDGTVEFCRRRGKPVSGGDLRVALQLGWGEDEFIKPGIGEERRREGPSPAMAVASPRDSKAVMGSPIVELGQDGLGRGILGVSSQRRVTCRGGKLGNGGAWCFF